MDTTRRRIRTIALAAPALLLAMACTTPRPWAEAHLVDDRRAVRGERTITIELARDGFMPSTIRVRVGERVRLRFERLGTSRCAREVIVSLGASREVRRPIAVGSSMDVVLDLHRPGELGFTCGMRMFGGTIDVQR